jgi:hypothetical protein
VGIFLQPAFVLRYDKSSPSAVALLMDDTLSMRWADRYPQGEELKALASFLKTPPEDLTGAERLTRSAILKKALGGSSDCLANLARKHQLFMMRFGGAETYTELLSQVLPTGKGRPAYKGVPPAAAEALGRLTAGGYETNLGRAIRETLEQLEGRRIAAIVLLTDGQNTGAAGAPERMSAMQTLLRERGVPTHCVALGDPLPPKNIMVAQLQGPGEVRKGSVAQLTAFVVSRQYNATLVTVRLERARAGTENWEDTGISEPLELAGQEGQEEAKMQEVQLGHKVDETGEYVYRAGIKPLDDEMLRTDNYATANVKVSDQKIMVLLVGGSASWEFQYLRNYMLRQPDHYSLTVFQQNADPAFNQDASTGMKRQSAPKTREDLYAYDVVVLYDPLYDAMGVDSESLDLLTDFVGKHHGGLCYIAGHKNTKDNLTEGGPFAKVGELLPVVLKHDRSTFAAESANPPRTAWALQVTSAGIDHPIMRLADGDEENQRIWSMLPGVYRSTPILRLKSLASALALHSDTARQTIDSQAEPLIAVQYYGKGRTVFFSFDTTWRWRLLGDLKHYQRFWANTLDFLSAGRLEKKRILITTGGDVFDAGSSVRIRAEAYKRNFTPMDGKTFSVEATHMESKQALSVTLNAVREGYFEGSMLAAKTGTYNILPKADATGMADWGEEDVAPKRIRVRLPEDEFRKPEANYQTLSELAGGPARFWKVYQLDKLAEAIPDARTQTILDEPYTLWNTPFALAVLGALLLLEWVVRKLLHMM